MHAQWYYTFNNINIARKPKLVKAILVANNRPTIGEQKKAIENFYNLLLIGLIMSVEMDFIERYGPPKYKIHHKLKFQGDELFVLRENSSTDLELMTDRLHRETFSRFTKLYPRRGPWSLPIKYKIANKNPAFRKKNNREIASITERLNRPTHSHIQRSKGALDPDEECPPHQKRLTYSDTFLKNRAHSALPPDGTEARRSANNQSRPKSCAPASRKTSARTRSPDGKLRKTRKKQYRKKSFFTFLDENFFSDDDDLVTEMGEQLSDRADTNSLISQCEHLELRLIDDLENPEDFHFGETEGNYETDTSSTSASSTVSAATDSEDEDLSSGTEGYEDGRCIGSAKAKKRNATKPTNKDSDSEDYTSDFNSTKDNSDDGSRINSDGESDTFSSNSNTSGISGENQRFNHSEQSPDLTKKTNSIKSDSQSSLQTRSFQSSASNHSDLSRTAVGDLEKTANNANRVIDASYQDKKPTDPDDTKSSRGSVDNSFIIPGKTLPLKNSKGSQTSMHSVKSDTSDVTIATSGSNSAEGIPNDGNHFSSRKSSSSISLHSEESKNGLRKRPSMSSSAQHSGSQSNQINSRNASRQTNIRLSTPSSKSTKSSTDTRHSMSRPSSRRSNISQYQDDVRSATPASSRIGLSPKSTHSRPSTGRSTQRSASRASLTSLKESPYSPCRNRRFSERNSSTMSSLENLSKGIASDSGNSIDNQPSPTPSSKTHKLYQRTPSRISVKSKDSIQSKRSLSLKSQISIDSK